MIIKPWVQTAIDSELTYQNTKWGNIDENGHSVPGWLLLMEKYLERAKYEWSRCGPDSKEYYSIENVRKLTALGIQCMNQHGVPLRS